MRKYCGFSREIHGLAVKLSAVIPCLQEEDGKCQRETPTERWLGSAKIRPMPVPVRSIRQFGSAPLANCQISTRVLSANRRDAAAKNRC
jgi:hypothetical protein